ncbi:MAG TPA: flagellar basal body P-ring formation chaperone FlgA [Nitrospiraceae bacterium]|nr:flagellar basal body P-ring formation chaperone FlgA [Nitrospiraceae bacterium]
MKRLLMMTVLVAACAGVGGLTSMGAAHPTEKAIATEAQRSGAPKEPARARGRQWIYPDRIRKAIYDHLQREFAGKVHEVHVTLGDPQQPIAAPGGALALTISSADIEGSLGRRVFQVHVAINGALSRTIEATTEVAAYLDTLTPVRLIKTDEEIDVDDVVTTRVALYDLRTVYATDPRDVIGKAAVRPLAPQTPIKLTALRRLFVVRKGDRVMIEAKMGGLSIQTAGVTKSNGELGQSVTVSNTDSGKEVRAKVVGPGVVRVDF